MANVKISELPTATTFNDDDYTVVVQNNTTKKITKENMYGGYIYSSDESVIGKWINDKPIYRKVIVLNSITPDSGTTKTILHNINNLERIVNLNCIVDNGSFQYNANNYTWVEDGANSMQIWVDNTTVFINFDGLHYLPYVDYAHIILEYTKRTD